MLFLFKSNFRSIEPSPPLFSPARFLSLSAEFLFVILFINSIHMNQLTAPRFTYSRPFSHIFFSARPIYCIFSMVP
ncbi:hypothetical protein I7I53_04552 [Histoplasma capsulatum var. duboisii H88]|uniref:Uncharacterized protein n=1 Tax=Ajellomyces capsulatus (strain H88) TaxID=544711 RepID=A0A8A1LVC3_AJEC8|nr:hypothetical protein I7I53_04552 [Histoplasma capsulatum var. duboisii H88]